MGFGYESLLTGVVEASLAPPLRLRSELMSKEAPSAVLMAAYLGFFLMSESFQVAFSSMSPPLLEKFNYLAFLVLFTMTPF